MPSTSRKIRCDGFGCDEDHPIEHDQIGEPGFDYGRWLGWLYLDLNRPDIFPRPLRFCSTSCCEDWLWRETTSRHKAETALDRAIRNPGDAIARKRARKDACHNPATVSDGHCG